MGYGLLVVGYLICLHARSEGFGSVAMHHGYGHGHGLHSIEEDSDYSDFGGRCLVRKMVPRILNRRALGKH